jgi:hypothetical protein
MLREKASLHEGHGFSRAVKGLRTTASAAEVRFSTHTGQVISLRDPTYALQPRSPPGSSENPAKLFAEAAQACAAEKKQADWGTFGASTGNNAYLESPSAGAFSITGEMDSMVIGSSLKSGHWVGIASTFALGHCVGMGSTFAFGG